MMTPTPAEPIHPAIVRVAATPLDAIRDLEGWYFGEGGFSPLKAVEFIRDEAALCGVPHVELTRSGSWWVLTASKDWLPSEDDGISAFFAPLPYPEGGPNGSRTEVLLTAFVKSLVTLKDGRAYFLVDESGEDENWLNAQGDRFHDVGRVIAFAA